ncbi:hypothetical protein RHOFW104T7_02370 [Rhodanobacter thiooxydans]|uniref:Acetoacetate decarboxylase n=1 Tax=Rhodanobacter thiooxydans TaxID=416169 RepID=A0A154QD04_9GAMM|nr:acetoacetate decarboxylase family protein [Rhodanobacter thiooxydans]EIM00588.1 hypothetical protein UUA_06579 [Rhodanobacter thiooxydans LCS2]KZC22105.1 hypothetical protein RHOFW104T7_02370 [Rhodanobacter thiooxydans]
MTTWQQDPFFQYPMTKFQCSEGEVDLPILYFDNSNMIPMFWVDHDKARAMLEPHALNAVRFAGGRALVAMGFYEYRHTAIGSYNEVGVAIAATPRGTPQPGFPLLSLFGSMDKPHVGFHVVDLPVTTAVACSAGREIWGFPKFVTQIDFSLKGPDFAGTVVDPQSKTPMVTLAGRVGLGIPGPLLDLVLYSTHDGKLLRTQVNTRGGARICLPGSIQLKVSDSDHPMAQRLRALGLQQARPAFVSHTHKLQLRLNAGAAIA